MLFRSAKLERLIAQTSYNMHQLAEYPRVMPDDIEIGLSSVPCYLENAAVVEKAVHDLDDKIDQLKRAREAVVALRATTHTRKEQVGSLNLDSKVGARVSAEGSAPRSPVRGVSRAPASDITGVREIRRKEAQQGEILGPFPSRDQLTGP